VDGLVSPVRIGDAEVGPGLRCFVIAEAGVNHNGSVDIARQLIDAAAAAGADAVKFQSFNADDLASPEAEKAPYQRAGDIATVSQVDFLRELELPREAHQELIEHAQARGILFLSTPFDESSLNELVELGVPALKVASPEITNTPFLEHFAATGLPLIVSTGMSTLDEVRAAVEALRAAGNTQLVLLHCVSAYPAPAGDVNLRAMDTLREEFDVPVGFSDHTLGGTVTIAAATLGASVIEKHLTLDRTLPGPDHAASLEPDEFAALVEAVREAQASLGDGVKQPVASELENRTVVRRSLAAAHDLSAGEILTRAALTALRPATGIEPTRVDEVVGRTLARDVASGELLDLSMFA
jgi:N,N'-diacetyllegionaminate synthase